MAEHIIIPADLLAALRLQLDNLSIATPSNDQFAGADVPSNCRMLIRQHSATAPSAQTLELWEPHAVKPAVTIPIHRPSTWRRRGRSTKAVALLVRGSSDTLWTAVSGWDAARPQLSSQLVASDALLKVKKMCIAIGHELAPHTWDQGEAGRYHACHAEKQLLAFLYEERTSYRKPARIHQTLPPCDDCHRCLKAFASATGMTITVVVHGDNDGVVSAAALPVPEKLRYGKDGIVVRTVRKR